MRSLSAAFGELNSEQQDAVTHTGDAVVLAGPGSGKTETLTIKVVHLLNSEIGPLRGLACITFGREAVGEFRSRLASFGVRAGRRLFLGTVHAFCMNRVIRPFAALAGMPELSERTVASSQVVANLRKRIADRLGVPSWQVSDAGLTTTRRMIACGESLEGYDPILINAARLYQSALDAQNLIDFEGMVLTAQRLIETNAFVREFLGARYRWLVVDEYQDMGGPLHKIVTALRLRAGMKVFAVGDPNQTIYDFTGANPKYLEELASTPDVQRFRLRLNYRSGQRLMAASEAVLRLPQSLGHLPDPKRVTLGEVFVHPVVGGVDAQVMYIAKHIIPGLRSQGVPYEQIAILYRMARSQVQSLSLILSALDEARIPYVAERDENALPRTAVVRWLQRCAGVAVALAARRVPEGRFAELVREYREIVQSAGRDVEREEACTLRHRLYAVLSHTIAPTDSAIDWARRAVEALELREILGQAPSRQDERESIDSLITTLGKPERASMGVSEFAADGRLAGRVVVTTYHSSKGRQFDAVVLPFLQEGLVPVRPWVKKFRRYDELGDHGASVERRLFYVAFTRARHQVHLVSSPQFTNDDGNVITLGPARFIGEIETRLKE